MILHFAVMSNRLIEMCEFSKSSVNTMKIGSSICPWMNPELSAVIREKNSACTEDLGETVEM